VYVMAWRRMDEPSGLLRNNDSLYSVDEAGFAQVTVSEVAP
jgi:hypothetical protein